MNRFPKSTIDYELHKQGKYSGREQWCVKCNKRYIESSKHRPCIEAKNTDDCLYCDECSVDKTMCNVCKKVPGFRCYSHAIQLEKCSKCNKRICSSCSQLSGHTFKHFKKCFGCKGVICDTCYPKYSSEFILKTCTKCYDVECEKCRFACREQATPEPEQPSIENENENEKSSASELEICDSDDDDDHVSTATKMINKEPAPVQALKYVNDDGKSLIKPTHVRMQPSFSILSEEVSIVEKPNAPPNKPVTPPQTLKTVDKPLQVTPKHTTVSTMKATATPEPVQKPVEAPVEQTKRKPESQNVELSKEPITKRGKTISYMHQLKSNDTTFTSFEIKTRLPFQYNCISYENFETAKPEDMRNIRYHECTMTAKIGDIDIGQQFKVIVHIKSKESTEAMLIFRSDDKEIQMRMSQSHIINFTIM